MTCKYPPCDTCKDIPRPHRDIAYPVDDVKGTKKKHRDITYSGDDVKGTKKKSKQDITDMAGEKNVYVCMYVYVSTDMQCIYIYMYTYMAVFEHGRRWD